MIILKALSKLPKKKKETMLKRKKTLTQFCRNKTKNLVTLNTCIINPDNYKLVNRRIIHEAYSYNKIFISLTIFIYQCKEIQKVYIVTSIKVPKVLQW